MKNLLRNVALFFLAIIIAVSVLYNFTIAQIDSELKSRNYEGVYDNCNKIWASRGLYNSHEEQNSITSMQNAFSHGAVGVEFDFYYDVASNTFIVSHGRPKKDSEGNLVYKKKENEILTVEKMLNTVGENHYFWFDYKNLDRLNEQETQKAIKKLLSITEFDSIRDRIYIEGSNPFILSSYTNAGFKTILGIHPLNDQTLFSSFVINIYKMGFYFSNISALAIQYGELNDSAYGPKAQQSLGSIPVFLFHVPDDDALLNQLIQNQNVRVLLVGRGESINRYDISNCSSNP